MPVLYGLTDTGAQVPIQVDTSGRLVAVGLQGAPGPMGPSGPTGPDGPAGPAGGSGETLWLMDRTVTLSGAVQTVWAWPLFVDPQALTIQRMRFSLAWTSQPISTQPKLFLHPYYGESIICSPGYETLVETSLNPPVVLNVDCQVWVMPDGGWKIKAIAQGGISRSSSVFYSFCWASHWNTSERVTTGSTLSFRASSTFPTANPPVLRTDYTLWSVERFPNPSAGVPSSL